MKIKYFIYAFIILISLQSCDLEEGLLDETLGENLLENATAGAILAPTFNKLRQAYGHRNLFALQEYSSDEAMLPTRINDWFDGGVFQSLHKHAWEITHPYTKVTWDELISGIASAIQAIDLLPVGSEDSAQALGVLSLDMALILDLFGQVPYRDINDINFNIDPQILTGLDAFNTIIANLEAAMPNLPSGSSTKFTKDAAKALMAKLYLNKAVYADRYASSFNFEAADMQKVIGLTTELINGSYSFNSDFFSTFDPDNEDHDEIIFAIKNELTSPGMGGHSVGRNTTNSISRGYYFTDGGGIKGSDAGCTLPAFFDTWDQTDKRFFKQNYPSAVGSIPLEQYHVNRGFHVGQQYGAHKNFTFDSNGELEIIALITKGDIPAIHTREVSLIAINQTTGIRVAKWGLDHTNKNRDDSGVDIVVFRLADMYLMRAEAKLRSGGEGLTDINTVREARNPGVGFGLTSATLDDVFRERGFEFYWEYHRRTDQIRFGKWEDSWQDKSSSDVTRRLFPIPPASIAVTPGLDQNEGY